MQWLRNIEAGRPARLVRRRKVLVLSDPVRLHGAEGARLVPAWTRVALRLLGTDEFVSLRADDPYDRPQEVARCRVRAIRRRPSTSTSRPSPPPRAPRCGVVRDRLVDAVPDAGQVISYQVPTITYRGTGLVALSVAKTHCSLHLMSPPLARALAGSLPEGRLSGATLHFPADAPLSEETVRRIADLRMAEVDARLDAR